MRCIGKELEDKLRITSARRIPVWRVWSWLMWTSGNLKAVPVPGKAVSDHWWIEEKDLLSILEETLSISV